MITALSGIKVVAKREFFSNLKSIRLVIITILFALAVLGGAYGLAQLSLKPELPLSETIKSVLSRGPDAILYLSSALVAFVGSLSALAISFDSIIKEKLQNSLALLLCRPVSRRSIILGKFLGLLSALSLPVVIITISSIACVTSVVGKSPSLPLATGFVFLTLIFLGIFIAIQQLFSILAKTLGTALLFGIAAWLLFTLFWTLIPLSLAYILGIPVEINSLEYNILRSKLDLFSPLGAYDSALGLLAGGAGVTPALPRFAPFLSLILWLILPLWLSAEVFRKRTE